MIAERRKYDQQTDHSNQRNQRTDRGRTGSYDEIRAGIY